ncbi:Hypothetical predicted protein [Mytilus galloprovincialis]|uniref:Uncharacterized protein n=1 Tax=Mytilus galloprovincialis TaxID=29158 RepID=A0A8B6ED59_MYTGA|nr:Hypothetical predicted protein [Mytilus galloprovincialis]
MHYFIPARRVNFLLRHSRSFFHKYDIVAEEHKESSEYFKSFTEDSDCCRASSFFKMPVFPSPGRRSRSFRRKSSPKSVDDMTLAQEKGE